MSETVTQTVLRKPVKKCTRRERVYDYLYDPVYTLSSEVDHVRSGLKACRSADRLRRVPVFGSMFSNLVHHPRYTLRLDPVDPVPPSVDRFWPGHTEQRRQALQHLTGVSPGGDTCHVTGVDRWKYFKRPLIPVTEPVLPNVVYSLPQKDFVSTDDKDVRQPPSCSTVAVQTDYRESEAQTDPYSPGYLIQPGGSTPELLHLQPLSWGRGLPAGLVEVEMIERARARRAWESSLPPLDDLSQLDKRRRTMEEMEAKEWAFREGEIQRLQEIRLAVLQDLLMQRDQAQNQMTQDRLNHLHSQHLKDRETKTEKIRETHVRSLRKLEAQRRDVEGKFQRAGCRDFSQNQRSLRPDVFRSPYLDTYEGLSDLEVRHSRRVEKPKRPISTKEVTQEPVNAAEELLNKYMVLREEESQQVMTSSSSSSSRFLLKKEKPAPRPATPRVEEPPKEEEEMELAVINLQKLLRGRRVQCEMFMGKENHQDLLRELRSTHALQKEERELQRADREFVLSLKQSRDRQLQEASQEEASRAEAVGAELECLFDTLSKELIRLQEERRIHAFSMLAERDRRLREAEESGRRRVEERRRREEDEIFRQVVQVHQDTVDLFLEDTILAATEQTADQQARDQIHRKAREVNDIAYAMEQSRNSRQSEEIVSELVYSFLIPEVEKIRIRGTVHLRQQRHLLAARSIVLGTAEDSATPGSPQSNCPPQNDSGPVVEDSPEEKDRQQEPESE
ncbi:cilia- and flagella-associated protein 91 [Cynoglossus semilaevis]|uniref:Cilia- and flagella-associated protein 91 n=1 Tax=Cynoglossus semilaevis TaxID=244447 RepID=A0A3P8WVK6_CYNSE|nr:cilia- and flagella-associated protein 91 [Cynoglossus semilaevis]